MTEPRPTQAQEPTEHGRPRRAWSWLLGFALAIGPVAWLAHLSMSYAIAAYGCYPHRAPLASPLWTHMHTDLIEIAVIALMLAALGIALAYSARQSAWEQPAAPPSKLPESGEGRTRFLATCAIVGGALFVIALIFDAIALAMVPACAWS
jgi:hypothetical protein